MGVRSSHFSYSRSYQIPTLIIIGSLFVLLLLSMLLRLKHPSGLDESSVRRCSWKNDAPSNFVESYSLWMMPDARSRVTAKLQNEIDTSRAAIHSSPRFPPHVTLLPDIKLPRETVVEMTVEMVKEMKKEASPWHARWQKVKKGSSYYQCVYILIQMDPVIMKAANVARRVFNMENLGPYMPHLSLLYADLSEQEKDEAVKGSIARLFGPGSSKLDAPGFTTQAVTIWYTPTEDKTLESWCRIADFEISI